MRRKGYVAPCKVLQSGPRGERLYIDHLPVVGAKAKVNSSRQKETGEMAKKPYERPKLVIHGNLKKVTGCFSQARSTNEKKILFVLQGIRFRD